MAQLEAPRPRSGYARHASPSGLSEASDTSLDESADTTLSNATERRSRGGVSSLLPTALRPTRKGSTEKAFDRWKLKERRPITTLLVLFISALVIIIVLVILLAYFIIHLSKQIPRNDIQRIVQSWGQPNTVTSSLADYPTRFSQGIKPIPCHSHNDYSRKVPLYDALHAGCTSVEADVWYSPRDLLVGHTINSLTEGRTLKSLYIDPLVSILSRQNPSSKPLTGDNTTPATTNITTSMSLHGIWDDSPSLPLVLLIDIKNDPEDIYKALYSALEPLRSRGWLTTFDGETTTQGLVTVVATGEAPFDLITKNSSTSTSSESRRRRDIFYDAPLTGLGAKDTKDSDRYNATNSYYASTNFQVGVGKLDHGVLSAKQVDIVRGQVAEAQRKGLKVRYWNTPGWPRSRREYVWDLLVKEGVDMLNVDDLVGVAQRRW